MSTLYLVRHAQASFFAEDYDQLSDLGRAQAAQLGRFLVAKGIRFDQVITGPAVRHRDTTALVDEAYRAADFPLPAPEIFDEFDEHDADQFLGHSLERIVAENPDICGLAEEYRGAVEREDIQRSFQRLFEAVVKLWVEDALSDNGVESFTDFHNRVHEGLRKIIHNERRGRRVLVVSSVGPISIILQNAMDSPDEAALELGWRLRNCCVNQFLFTSGRITLDRFNSTAHLDDDHVTYR